MNDFLIRLGLLAFVVLALNLLAGLVAAFAAEFVLGLASRSVPGWAVWWLGIDLALLVVGALSLFASFLFEDRY